LWFTGFIPTGVPTNWCAAWIWIDPRINRCKLHSLLDIIILSILAVLCGADTYEETELFGKENYYFLKQFLSLKNGIPSHDTVNRVFQRINPLGLNAVLSCGLRD
jgi:hypothetical protein